MSSVDSAIEELEAADAAIEPQVEGLEDYYRLNIQEPTRAEVQSALSIYGRRAGLIEDALTALEALKADGYPDVPGLTVSAAVLADLQAQEQTISAALAQFSTTAPAASLEAEAGAPVPKA